MEKTAYQRSRGPQLSKSILAGLYNALDGNKINSWSGSQNLEIRCIREHNASSQVYRATVRRMKKQGWIEDARRQGEKFLKLTKKGKVRALLSLIQNNYSKSKSHWDRKWRVAIFDIPEE